MATSSTADTDFDTCWLLARAQTPFVTHILNQKTILTALVVGRT